MCRLCVVLSACLSAILLCGSRYLLLRYEIPVSSGESYLEVSVMHAYYTNTPHTFKIQLIHCVDTASHLTGFFFFACDYNPRFLVYSCRHGTNQVGRSNLSLGSAILAIDSPLVLFSLH